MVQKSSGYKDSSEALPPHCGALAQAIIDPRPPRCRYCGELSIYPWGGQQVCARCEAIRSRIEQAAFGGIIEMVTHAQRRLGDDELYRAVTSALAHREHYAAKIEHQKRRRASSSPWAGVVVVAPLRRRAG